ncbi:MAG: transposase, partial [Rubrobacter sp.]
PALRPGQIVVVDNRTGTPLSAHKGGRVEEIVESTGCEIVYLPPYSSDLNPIEEAFSKVKGLMRKTKARTREALIDVMGQALDAVTIRDIGGFFGHCGYLTVGQSL